MKIPSWEMTRFSTEIDYESGRKNVRRVGPRQFQFLEVIDMPSATGEGDRSERWHVGLTYVDLDAIPSKEIEAAKRSCGWEPEPEPVTPGTRAVAECCDQYGLHATLWQGQGPNRRRLMAAAYREANAALDPAKLEEMLGATANKIGSTQKEMMTGDVYAALARNDGPDAQIMKMLAAATFPCPTCGGSGHEQGGAIHCRQCEGKGRVVQTLGGLIPAPEGT